MAGWVVIRALITFLSVLVLIDAKQDAVEHQVIDAQVSAQTIYDYYKLPTSVRPKTYRLEIVTHLEDPKNLYFNGNVKIEFEVLEDTNNITLHVQNLTIDSKKISIENTDPEVVTKNCIESVDVVSEHDYYIMELCEPLAKGDNCVITIPFEAPLNERLQGYYRSSYFDKESNGTRWLSVTQFEPAHARAAFPCFDEPQLKAKFTVVLGHHKNYTALSNMPLKEIKLIDNMPDWIWSEFEESVPMSTYLVAYTINDFSFVKSTTKLKDEVQFKTWARRDAIDQCFYAGEVGPKVLKFYEDIFDIKFPLAKIDQIAIPDFSAGAMENWGLVTYRETALLYAMNVSSVANKQRVASVIAHELAHQWFGNLVTMKWWTDLWLNEGFATYIATLGVEHLSPEWNALMEESVSNTLAIFKVDALKSSHPISQPIEHTNQISEIFDSISYKKGSAVIRMMHLFLGDDSFRSGIYNYLKRHAYDNAEQDNLWSALTESAHKYRSIPQHFSIKQIMDSWTLQTGYPVITITRDYDKQSANVTQVRYLLDSQAVRKDSGNCWWIPLSYTTEKEADFDLIAPKDWLECNANNAPISKVLENMPDNDEWIICNVQMSGLYKLKYDERNWNMLIKTLLSEDYKKIHIINRAHLIDDALSLAWSGDQDYDVAMRLIEYLMREREYIPWKAALENLGHVNQILRQTPHYEFFKKYMRKILTPIYIYMNGINDTTIATTDTPITTPTDAPDANKRSDILHKVLIAGWACRFEVEDCIPRARQYFKDWQKVANPDNYNPIPSDLRTVVYCTAIRHGNDEDWTFLWTRYKNSNVASEKRTILSALGCSREIWVLQRYLEWAFDETSQIRKQDSHFAFGSVAHSEIGFHLAKNYFMSNIKFLHNFYGPDSSELSRLLHPLASQMISDRDYETVKNFAEEYKDLLKKSEQGVRRALETIHINAQWRERNYDEIAARLRRRI